MLIFGSMYIFGKKVEMLVKGKIQKSLAKGKTNAPAKWSFKRWKNPNPNPNPKHDIPWSNLKHFIKY